MCILVYFGVCLFILVFKSILVFLIIPSSIEINTMKQIVALYICQKQQSGICLYTVWLGQSCLLTKIAVKSNSEKQKLLSG